MSSVAPCHPLRGPHRSSPCGYNRPVPIHEAGDEFPGHLSLLSSGKSWVRRYSCRLLIPLATASSPNSLIPEAYIMREESADKGNETNGIFIQINGSPSDSGSRIPPLVISLTSPTNRMKIMNPKSYNGSIRCIPVAYSLCTRFLSLHWHTVGHSLAMITATES